jgi:hypothetical protein
MGKADGGAESLARWTRTGSAPRCSIGAASGGNGGDPAGPMAMAESGSMLQVNAWVLKFDGTHDGPGGAGIGTLQSRPF